MVSTQLLNDAHKQKLLEIVEQNPTDIASLLDYLEKNLNLFPEDLEEQDKEVFKFFIIKSFADKISSLNSKKEFKQASELLEELKEFLEDFLNEYLETNEKYSLKIGNIIYSTKLDLDNAEMDIDYDDEELRVLAEPFEKSAEDSINFFNNIYELQNYINPTLTTEITAEQLNALLKVRYIDFTKIYGISLLKTLSLPEFEIALPALNPDGKTLVMKVFSISDNNVFNTNFQLANAIIYLTDKFDQSGKADYGSGLTLCVSNEVITSQEILPLTGEVL